MTWNYRVLVRSNESGETLDYVVIEVYYNDNGEIDGYIQKPQHPHGETMAELVEDIEYFRAATAETVLTLDDLP